ncbi:uncharacterized protein HMPREF1541_08605 [Cyphellophora europaea CBS 101466]|uniref:NAD dependent epimerase/dehydratase n=1 Tax=Cyphellophora europaea (strain CBS 101466) TaxID=1220924 RepID=W2RKU0_CYPE1|nr:uncharacterized protein HMPREF1541_08605 [Cyphellophora europaea CBS 101466]ETN36328.1 hypothetical protein HMPREF1541_08605 [Cyphellophora europaea CBS 101466]
MPHINSWFWYILENYIYAIPEPPPHTRTKPLEVICVGLPRSATHSLKEALIILGHENVYHGFDVLREQPVPRMRAWGRLTRLKHFPNLSSTAPYPGPVNTPTGLLNSSHFDPLIGHCTALIDSPASVFAADLIHAYPNAKIILNTRTNADDWQRSVNDAILRPLISYPGILIQYLDPTFFWMYHVFCRLIDPALFRASHPSASGIHDAMAGKGRATKIEHEAMVRGLMIGQEHRFLEWSVQDDWEPLCEFLGKEKPEKEFPRANTTRDIGELEMEVLRQAGLRVLKRLLVLAAVGVAVGAMVWKKRGGGPELLSF